MMQPVMKADKKTSKINALENRKKADAAREEEKKEEEAKDDGDTEAKIIAVSEEIVTKKKDIPEPEKKVEKAPVKISAPKSKKLVVLGSIKHDIFMPKTDGTPETGPKVAPSEDLVLKAYGGKAANLAISAARAQNDCEVKLLGHLSDEAYGKRYLELLNQSGVETSGVILGEYNPKDKDKRIDFMYAYDERWRKVYDYWSFYDKKVELTDEWKEAITTADVLLLQREIPQVLNIEAAKLAKANNVKVVLDMGGKAERIENELGKNIDIAVSNGSTDQIRFDDIEFFHEYYPDCDVLYK